MAQLWLNFGLAWVSVALVLVLSVIYILRVASGKNTGKAAAFLRRANKACRKYHKSIGLALVATGLIHGLSSSQAVWTFNIGTVSWVASIRRA